MGWCDICFVYEPKVYILPTHILLKEAGATPTLVCESCFYKKVAKTVIAYDAVPIFYTEYYKKYYDEKEKAIDKGRITMGYRATNGGIDYQGLGYQRPGMYGWSGYGFDDEGEPTLMTIDLSTNTVVITGEVEEKENKVDEQTPPVS